MLWQTKLAICSQQYWHPQVHNMSKQQIVPPSHGVTATLPGVTCLYLLEVSLSMSQTSILYRKMC